KDGATRKDVKVALIRLLYERGYSREQVVQLFTIIDWMLQLPRALEPAFVQAVYAIQEEKHMPYVNTIERVEREKERQEGEQQGIEKGRLEASRETARNLIKLGVLSDEQIAEATGLADADVQALRVEDKH
ncbi:putative transposase/invertase (TIGR01784 family), partial [Halomonas ventosae]